MKFGNYNITTAPKERSRKFDLFRFSKIKSTTNSFVDRFQSKIETFRRLKSRSESPLSFRASLFERDGVGLFPRPVYEKFSPKDFPKSHYRGDNFYVFGNTIRKLSDNQKSISGKNNYLSENFYCTLRTAAATAGAAAPTTTVTTTTTGDEQQPVSGTSFNSRNRQSSTTSTAKKSTSANTKTLTIERKEKKHSTKSRHCDATEQSSSGIGSYVEKEIDLNTVNRSTLNRRYTNSLKDMLDSVSYLDEDTEFKVLKDYFETNSYSDIVKDTAFKDYLNKKNYNDILDYLNEDGTPNTEGTMRLKSYTPLIEENMMGFYENATDNTKLYRWKSTGNLYESLISYNNNNNGGNNKINGCTSNRPNSRNVLVHPNVDGFKTVDRLETSTYRRQRKPPTYIGSTTSLNRRTNSKILQKQRERDREQEWRYFNTSTTLLPEKFASCTLNSTNRSREFKRSVSDSGFTSSLPKQSNHYEDVKRFCELFLDEHYTFNSKWSKFDTSTLAKKYTERQYKKLIGKFIKSKGYSSPDEYVQAKFGTILDRSIPKSAAMKSDKLDLPKTYIDNVQRRYHVTKQHFLAAERMRNESVAQPEVQSQSQRDHYHRHHHHHHHHHHHYGQSTNAKLSKSCSFDCRSALDHCTGGCMTTGRRKHKDFSMSSSTGSLPSLFRSQANRDESFGRRYLDSSNCDIYCSSCMLNSFQKIPYQSEHSNYYDFNYQRNQLHCSREENTHTLQSQSSRRRCQQQQQEQPLYRAPSRIYNRHNEYNHLHPSTTLCSNYGYRDQIHSEEMASLVPPGLHGKEDILFGNLNELYTFHSEVFLKDLENCISTTELVALCFVQRRDTFYRLYSFYCQNIPRSERLRETLVDTHLFLQECQKRLGHKLPLAAYLLKPVQRITKYQLLLKDLLRFSDNGTCAKELQKALDCMLIVLKCVNDSMHQIAITGFPADLTQQGELLLQDSFQVWTESKKDIRLRLKTQQRHIFLYQKAMLFCKQASKTGHTKSTYQFKHYVKMSQIGLTESVRGDARRFEVWLQGRQEVHTIQATTVEIKNKWVAEIKKVLLNQLEELKDEKIKQYSLSHSANPFRPLRQTVSWDTPNAMQTTPQRAMSIDTNSTNSNETNRCSNISDESGPITTPAAPISSSSSEHDNHEAGHDWSSDYSNSEDEYPNAEDTALGNRFISLADYCAMGHSEVSMKEGDVVEFLKRGIGGWVYVKILSNNGGEGWAPAAFLEPIHRRTHRSGSKHTATE
ncbi:uncharacterized protein LOC129574045 isoform X11 [Sitodiplosis mosellana]|uniref:uncharacterized protein LOC129574045 isoform X11 n=1 Tax=Sitodiplosis mosellana TaxID=263140 RepID=UPI002444E3C1|nr:uncharacterized protein LOC129574045 isoform X11 [Sitodiplosis mosellana]